MTESLRAILAGGPHPAVPLRLRERHLATAVGVTERVSARTAATWPGGLATDGLLRAVLEGAGLVSGSAGVWTRAHTLADTVGAGMRLLVVGLNPSPYAADVGVGFARPGNRFWPAALRSGIVTVDRDPLHALIEHGVGMTDLVKRATARADELSPAEYRAGVGRLRTLVAWLEPRVVCVVGLTGWRHAVDRTATSGVRPELFAGRPVYVMPNPSGLNAHVTTDDLAAHFRRAIERADAEPNSVG